MRARRGERPTVAPSVRRVDLASLALLILGLVFGVISVVAVVRHDAALWVVIPSLVATWTGARHLVKRVAVLP